MAQAQALVDGLLLAAVKHHTVEVVDALISNHSANAKQATATSGTLLHEAINHPSSWQALQICKVLVEKHGLDAVGKDMFAQTPLFAAAKRGDVELCNFFLDNGCNANDLDSKCQTALFFATRHGNIHASEALLKRGSNLEQKDDCGYTPIFWAAEGNQPKMMRVLVEHGARLDQLSNKKRDVFHSATGAAIEEAILLGCDVKQLNSLNQTRLNSYVIKGDFEKCKVLVKHGVDVNHQDKYGQTCFFYAANLDTKDAMEFLYKELNANIFIQDGRKKTAREWVTEHGKSKNKDAMMKFLSNLEKKEKQAGDKHKAAEKKRQQQEQKRQEELRRQEQRKRQQEGRAAASNKKRRVPTPDREDTRRRYRLECTEDGDDVGPGSEKYEALLEDLFSQCPWLKPLEARSPESSVNNAK